MQSALAPASRTAPHHNVLAILARRPFRRLLTVRLLSQLADGWFQAGLAGSVFFNPEQAASPIAITAAFAVLLLPYSVLGPFVGVFLDRWSRRASLAVANLSRAVFVVPAAICVWYGFENMVFLLAALCVVALNRFYLAGLSAAQPHVVEPERLVTANSFATTAGTVCYSAGLASAGGAVRIFGTGLHNYAVVALVAAMAYFVSATLTLMWFRPDALGPDDTARPVASILRGLVDTGKGMVSGFRHLAHRPVATTVLLTQSAHRLLFGVLTIDTLLLYRNYYASHNAGAAIAGLLPVAAAAAGGALLAAIVTPPLSRRLGAGRWILLLASALAVLVPVLGVPFVPVLTVATAFVVSVGSQGTKIITDTTLQLDVEDDFRGRVFSLNDTGFNLMFVSGLFIGALTLPATGVSAAVMIGVGVGYALIAVGFAIASRRMPGRMGSVLPQAALSRPSE
jgi:MFS family permease